MAIKTFALVVNHSNEKKLIHLQIKSHIFQQLQFSIILSRLQLETFLIWLSIWLKKWALKSCVFLCIWKFKFKPPLKTNFLSPVQCSVKNLQVDFSGLVWLELNRLCSLQQNLFETKNPKIANDFFNYLDNQTHKAPKLKPLFLL